MSRHFEPSVARVSVEPSVALVSFAALARGGQASAAAVMKTSALEHGWISILGIIQ